MFIKKPILRTSENKNLAEMVHKACVEYLNAVNNFRNRDLVIELLQFIISDCQTVSARELAITSLAGSGGVNDEKIVQILINLVEIESNVQTRNVALNGLKRYNISEHVDQLRDWLQDANHSVRSNAATIALQNIAQFDFLEIQDLFERENDIQCKRLLGQMLLSKDKEKGGEYFLSILDLIGEQLMPMVIDLLNSSNISTGLEKIKEMSASGTYSPPVQQAFDRYIKRYEKPV